MSEELDAAKLGARNNRTDKQRIRDMRKAARSIQDTTMEMEPDDDDAPAKADLPIENEEQPVILGTVRAVKADSDEWALDVLGVPFGGHNGGKDSDGEYFSAQTKLYLDRYTPIPLYYHGFDENGRPHGEPQVLGKTVSHEKRSDGWWFRVVLDKTSTYAKRVWDAAKQGIARASSGSITHLVRKDRDGHILQWPAVELSIFDTGGKRQPANQYAVALPVMKSHYDLAGLQLPAADIDASQPEADAREVPASTYRANAAKGDNTQTNNSSGVLDMKEEEVNELVAKSVAAALQKQAEAAAEAAKREADEKAKIDAALKAQAEQFEAKLKEANDKAAEGRRLPMGGEAPYVAKFANLQKFDDLEPVDLAFAYGVLQAAKSIGRSKRGASEDLMKALAVAIVEAKDPNGELNAAKREMHDSIKGVALKANELNQSTLASYGDEWIGVTYSTQLWRRIILPTSIVGKIPTLTVPQGSESIIIPVESTAPTFYKVAQASAQGANPGPITETITTSRMGTLNKTLNVSKLGAAAQYTGELEEDSLIPWATELRRSLTTEAQIVLEHIVIDGDTATGATTNINHIGGTPGGTEAYLLLDGFRKLALVTNTANSRDAGSLTVDDYLETVKLMGLAGTNAVDQNAVSFIIDNPTRWASLALTEVKNQDYTRAALTLDSGRIVSMWGYDIMNSPYMHRANQDAAYGLKANDAGKVDLTTPANNTKGAILAVRWDQWRLGYKRQITFEVERFPRADATSIVAMLRIGMVYRDTEASAISFNVTV